MAKPLVHGVYSSSTQTWQYIVADPATGHCIIFDPTRDVSAEEVNMSTDAADQVFELVRRRGYFVQCIAETRTSQAEVRSAAWYLRMRLRDWQGHAPALFSRGATVDVMARLFNRKYGTRSGFSSSIQRPLEDGEVTMVGQMPVKCLMLPGSYVAGHCVFLVGNCLFGGHSVVQSFRGISSSPRRPETSGGADNELLSDYMYSSLHRAFAGQDTVRVYLDAGPMPTSQTEPYEDVKQLLPMAARYDFGAPAPPSVHIRNGIRQSA